MSHSNWCIQKKDYQCEDKCLNQSTGKHTRSSLCKDKQETNEMNKIKGNEEKEKRIIMNTLTEKVMVIKTPYDSWYLNEYK